MLAPTVQASKSNLEAAHSGKRPPRAELLDKYPVTWVEIPQDGGRFFGKVNNYGVVEVEEEIIPLTNERWFTREELREAYLSGDVNEHLTQALMGAII